MEVTVRCVDGEAQVAVQVLWRGAEINLLRDRTEPVERFVQRLGLSCGKHVGGDKKRLKKEKKKLPAAAGEGAAARAAAGGGSSASSSLQKKTGAPPEPAPGAGVPAALLSSDGSRVPDGLAVNEALRLASHVEIDGERLPLLVNPPVIAKLEVFGKPIAGCPLVASLRCEFCEASAFQLRWILQAAAGSDPEGECIGEGFMIWVPQSAVGKTLTLRCDPRLSVEGHEASAPSGRAKIHRLPGVVEEVAGGWPDRRLEVLGKAPNPETSLRVVSYNMLAPPYANSLTAKRDLFPYCPPWALDFTYRQPLLGRELLRLDADIVFLQEVTLSTCMKFITPLFGDKYAVRCTLKASRVSEGEALLLRKSAFQILEEKDRLFKEIFRQDSKMHQSLREVAAKWPDFLRGVLPHMSTVFQFSVVRHIATGEVLVLANTHLFFHPLARHIRMLQLQCLLHEVAELREKYRLSPDGPLPRVIFGGDLNCKPDTAPVKHLLLEGMVPSDHPDWEHAKIFRWGRDTDDDDGVEPGEGSDDEGDKARRKRPRRSYGGVSEDEDDDIVPLPKEEWQPGTGLTLTSPLGALEDAFAAKSHQLPFTNYVNGFSGTLDYILLAGKFKVLNAQPGVEEEELQAQGGLPNPSYPSDHLSIAVDLEL